jgi:hypothetical protein
MLNKLLGMFGYKIIPKMKSFTYLGKEYFEPLSCSGASTSIVDAHGYPLPFTVEDEEHRLLVIRMMNQSLGV